MSVATAIARFRAKQAEQFTTEANVYRPVGEPAWDPDAETTVQGFALVCSGPCKIRPSAARTADEVEAGETLIGQPDSEGKWPVDSDIERGDVVIVTASLYDSGFVGRAFTVTKAPHDEWQIARVAQLEETLPPLMSEVS